MSTKSTLNMNGDIFYNGWIATPNIYTEAEGKERTIIAGKN